MNKRLREVLDMAKRKWKIGGLSKEDAKEWYVSEANNDKELYEARKEIDEW